MFDLTFIEKIKRWLTNIQVKIKGEVDKVFIFLTDALRTRLLNEFVSCFCVMLTGEPFDYCLSYKLL